MPSALTLYPVGRSPRLLVLRDGHCLEVGRSPKCDVILEDDRVSKRHALLRCESRAGWVLEDLGSKNGTRVNGEPVGEKGLESGDWISFGGFVARFERLSAARAAGLDSERLVRSQTLARMRRCLVPGLTPHELLLRLLESAMTLAGADRGFVVARDRWGAFRPEVASGFSVTDLWDERFRGSASAVRDVLDSRGFLAVSDAVADPRLGSPTSVMELGVWSIACLLLKNRDAVLGVLYVDSRRSRRQFTAQDMEALETLADHASVVLAGTHEGSEAEEASGGPIRVGLTSLMEQRLRDLIPVWEET